MSALTTDLGDTLLKYNNCSISQNNSWFYIFHSLGKLIGFGQFGDVFKGILNTSKEDIEVAIKTLK